MDKAAIFTAILRRNKLRRDNGLPTLDVRTEYAHEVSIAEQREFWEFCEQHADEREAIHQQAFAEFCAQHGPAASHTGAQRWMLRKLIRKRFEEVMARRFGIARPPSVAGRNPIIYGADRKDEA
jgi:hypothetical protein